VNRIDQETEKEVRAHKGFRAIQEEEEEEKPHAASWTSLTNIITKWSLYCYWTIFLFVHIFSAFVRNIHFFSVQSSSCIWGLTCSQYQEFSLKMLPLFTFAKLLSV
jgi:hypothetical protein